MVDGEVNRGITVKDPELMQLGKSIAEKLPESYGPLNVQVFYDANDHSIYVTDINPRFGGGYPLVHAAGGTFTDWLIQEALGKPLDIPKDNWIPNLLMRRYRENIFTVL
ncbi:MAG: hypothetical protein A2007_04555 [Verrucomicrobia bacterium GWC2_42_7]|nr:MAG: hypothetical protein A2007_04555 [Verrucomicrobia bacterium GWC2_42_7]